MESVSVWAFTPRPLRLLLVKRTPERAAGWQPVTGRLEPGERASVACLRELAEETGLPPPEELIDLEHESGFVGYDGASYHQRAFAARYDDALPPRVSHEHEDAQWVSVDEARAMLRWDDDRALLDVVLARLGQPSNS